MSETIRILGFAGSLRKGSLNRAVLRAAEEVLPERIELETFDLSPIPLYNGDVEAEGVPEPVQHFKDRIRAADALLIVTPEYNYSVPGVLKNAIDWASRFPNNSPLNGKPVAITGAGGQLGTVRAQTHLRQILLHNNVHILNKPELYITRAREQFDAEGRLTDDETRERLHGLLLALSDWTRRLKSEA